MNITTVLRIPRGITLRGESRELVSLCWPAREEPLPSLIEGTGFSLEDLTLYTWGRHRNVITGENDVHVRRVRIRANAYFMLMPDMSERYGIRVTEGPEKMGYAIEMSGTNVEVTDCDIFHSHMAFELKHVRGGLFARNRVRALNLVAISGGQGIVFEHNEYAGNQLMSGGNSLALHMGARSCRNVYYAHNTVQDIYGGDHEALTFDGHGTAYLGGVAEAGERSVVLAADPLWGTASKDMIDSWHDTTLFVLSGKGAGQHRRVVACHGRDVEIDRPWDARPDASSVVSIGGFNGRHIIVGNTARDAGSTVQLYPPNCECIVAENRGFRAGNLNAGGMLSLHMPWAGLRVEPCWYHQFFDNEIAEGNGFGDGGARGTGEVNGLLGGEAVMNIYGDNREAGSAVAITRYQVVRRHRGANNSSVRIQGSVSDVLVEGSTICNNDTGLHVISAAASDGTASAKAHCPRRILLRNNSFEAVAQPYVLDPATVSDVICVNG